MFSRDFREVFAKFSRGFREVFVRFLLSFREVFARLSLQKYFRERFVRAEIIEITNQFLRAAGAPRRAVAGAPAARKKLID